MEQTELKNLLESLCRTLNDRHSSSEKCFVEKWILLDGGGTDLISFERTDFSVSATIFRTKNETPYIQLLNYIEGLEPVRVIVPIAGYNTKPEQLVTKLLKRAYVASEEKFDADRLFHSLIEFLALLSKESHDFSAVGRLLGVCLDVDCIELSEEVNLVRLDNDAINERQPEIRNLSSHPVILDYSNSNVEIRIRKTFQIVPHSEHSYFNIGNKAREEFNNIIDLVVKTIKLYRTGVYYIYPRSFSSPLVEGGESFPMDIKYIRPSDIQKFNESDAGKLKESFLLVKDTIQNDQVLARSFSRFLIGVDERIAEERIVDFVIAWESILLTCKGDSIKAEQIYRFSLNGAALLSFVDSSLNFIEMKEFMTNCYNIRSNIVHGADKSNNNKILKKLNFISLDAVNTRISELYRKTISRLASIDINERPYKAENGWEILLRQKSV